MLPIDRPPIQDGWIEVADGRIIGVGDGRPPAPAEDLGDVALLPGLVNAHTHLELSWMAGRVPPASSMVAWIRSLLAARVADGVEPSSGNGSEVAGAIAIARSTGTALVGDISNTVITPGLIASGGLGGVVFHELVGFRAADPGSLVREAWAKVDEVRTSNFELRSSDAVVDYSVVAHAPYSVSPELFRAIAASRRHAPLTVHLGESLEEVEFLQTGLGPFRELLEDLGAWTADWPVPRCDPAEYLDRLGYLGPGCLAVHGVHLSDVALERLRNRGAVLVTCPRSNAWVGAGSPPVSRFYRSGLPVAIGTDSLASVATLNLFDELAELHRLAPDVASSRLLESATRIGAEALGLGAEFGTLTAGKRAAFVAVDVPRGRLADVEEYLVSGVEPARIQWVNG